MPDPGKSPAEETETGYLSLGISWTDAIHSRATEVGLNAERRVNAIYMALFDQANQLIYLTDFGGADNTTGGVFSGDSVYNSTSLSGFVSKAICLEKATYQLVVIANPYPVLKSKLTARAIAWEDLYDYVITQGNGAGETNLLDLDGGVFMSNARGITTLYPSDFRDSPAEAIATPKEVAIDRILAKILVNKDASFSSPPHGEVTAFYWRTGNCNRKTYLIRKPDLTLAGTAETALSPRDMIYAKDPNFQLNEQNTTELYTSADTKPWNEDPATIESHYQYVLENTLATETQTDNNWRQHTTHVVVEATIKYSALGTGGELQYYSFVNSAGEAKVFSHPQAVEWWANGVAAAQAFPADMVGLKEAIDACSVFSFGESSVVPTEYATDNGITFHKEGRNTYQVPIRHFHLTGAADRSRYGQYGVVRNNVYKLVVTGIKGPGTPTTGEAYIAVDIHVNPWYIREQEEHLQ